MAIRVSAGTGMEVPPSVDQDQHGAQNTSHLRTSCHDFPKFIINEAKALATDSAYLVTAKKDIDINSLVLLFYNSLTLVFSEINGRFYGGGVLELTPNEFKKLPIPT
jgi:hypothetical protein